MAEQTKRLQRSRTDRKIAGVVGGLASYTGLDPSVLRIVYFILTLLTGFVPGIFLYLVMTFIVPIEPKGGAKAD